MPSTNEVISLVDAADSAVWAAGVLELLQDDRPVPTYAGDVLDRAIGMLDDALRGSAVLTGDGDSRGFSGNLDALCWATDSYVAVSTQPSARPDPSEVQQSLTQIQQQMRELRKGIITGSSDGFQHLSFGEAKRFFDALSKVLSQRATASLTRPSGVYTAVGAS